MSKHGITDAPMFGKQRGFAGFYLATVVCSRRNFVLYGLLADFSPIVGFFCLKDKFLVVSHLSGSLREIHGSFCLPLLTVADLLQALIQSTYDSQTIVAVSSARALLSQKVHKLRVKGIAIPNAWGD